MKPSLRRILNLLFIFATFGVILGLAFSNSELSDAWEALFMLRGGWLLAAFFGWLGYMGFDALSLHLFLRKQGYGVSVPYALFLSLIGIYYSNITPGASGGQPMQIYYMKKRNVPVGVGSSAISLKLFCMQFMIVFMGVALWLYNRDFINAQLGGVKWVIIIGVIINAAAVPLVILVAYYRSLVQGLGNLLIRAGVRLRLIKNPGLAHMRFESTLDTFHHSMISVSRHPWHIAQQMLLAGLSSLCLMSIPVSVYHAFSMSGVEWYKLLTISFLLFMSASYTPLPGASGAQEGGFLVFYGGIFTSGTIGLALLVWRFFSYYLFLLFGSAASIANSIRASRRKKKEAART